MSLAEKPLNALRGLSIVTLLGFLDSMRNREEGGLGYGFLRKCGPIRLGRRMGEGTRPYAWPEFEGGRPHVEICLTADS